MKVFGTHEQLARACRDRGEAYGRMIAPACTPIEGGYIINRNHPAFLISRLWWVPGAVLHQILKPFAAKIGLEPKRCGCGARAVKIDTWWDGFKNFTWWYWRKWYRVGEID